MEPYNRLYTGKYRANNRIQTYHY